MRRRSLAIFILLVSVSWSTGQTEDEDDLLSRPRRERVVRGTSRRNTICTITMRGRTRRESIQTRVSCNGENIFDRDIAADDISEQNLEHGIRLFVETDDGLAFLYLDDESNVNIVNSRFNNFPEIPDTEVYAPVVITGGRMDITNTTIEGNVAQIGGMVISGSANVDLYNVSFTRNAGVEGTLVLSDDARADIELCFFTDNSGDDVGGIKVSNDAITLIADSLFERNSGAIQANEIYITDDGTCFMEDSAIYGDEENEDFEEFLMDNDRPDSDVEEFDLPFGGVAAITGRGTMLFADSSAEGHLGKFGAFYIVGSPVFSALRTDFIGNRAVTGGGLFANVERSGYARVLECNFTANTARNGGALVFAGNGTYTIDECHFENNTALNGGAIWGDYSEGNSCPRASSGSRVTILNSTFVQNTAEFSGGAFFIRCTDIFAENTTFENNEALDGNGGCIFALNTFDLRFTRCSMSSNTASGSGGAIYVNGSNDIVMEDCRVEGNSAGEDGGTIASLGGNGIIFRRSNLNNSIAGRHGGGIYASNLEMVRFTNTPLVGNTAGGRGGVFAGSNVGSFRWRSLTIDSNTAARSGAVHIEGGGSFEARTVRFLKNRATSRDSGAIFVSNVQNVTITAVSFFDNLASGECGAVSIGGASKVELVNTKLEDNSAAGGGAMCMDDSTNTIMRNVQFLGNTAVDGNGGAMTIKDSANMSFTNVSFIQNAAAQLCGAISVDQTSGLEIVDSVIESNRGQSGGGLCASQSEDLSLMHVNFESNIAIDGNGGAIHFTRGGSLSLSSVRVFNSTSTKSGGALFLDALSSASIVDSNITNSSAVISAGCLYVRSIADVGIENSTFMHCEAGNGGAAIFTGTSVISGDDATFDQNVAQNGGGAFLCNQETDIHFTGSFFYHNAAPEGSTMNADCHCQTKITHSKVYRDEDRPDNGDFFSINAQCSNLELFGNQLVGGIENSDKIEWYEWVGLGIGIALVLLLVLCCCRWYRKRRNQKAVTGKSQNVTSKDTDEDDDEEESEEESDDSGSYISEEDESEPSGTKEAASQNGHRQGGHR